MHKLNMENEVKWYFLITFLELPNIGNQPLLETRHEYLFLINLFSRTKVSEDIMSCRFTAF